MQDQIISALKDAHDWRCMVHYADTITSTNDVLKQFAREGAPNGTTIVASHQTNGKGRLGRTFLSPPDVGVYLSVLLRPNCRPDKLMHLTCAAAVAACEALSQSAVIEPGIKWTNDIVCMKRKISGILTETGVDSFGNIDYAVIGIGVNCNQNPDDFPDEIRGFAGSLAGISGKPVNRSAVAASLIDAFYRMDERVLTEKEQILREYKSKCITIGQEISVVRAEAIRHGKALDIDSNGGLIVQFDNGIIETVASGEVSVRGLYHYV